ncbi:hypothetical protein [Mucilaginibacter phyllosphaerae]
MQFKNEELEFIDALVEKIDPWSPAVFYIHAILNAKPLNDVIDFYLNRRSLIKQFESNIMRRLSEKPPVDTLFPEILNELEKSDYIKRCRIRNIMVAMERHLTADQLQECFTVFINSKYIYEVNAALKIAPKIWDEYIEDKLRRLFEINHNPNIIECFVAADKFDFLNEIIEVVWKGNSSFQIKKYFFRHFEKFDFRTLMFLEHCDPYNFLKAAFIHGKKLPHGKVQSIFDNITSRETKTFAVGLLSKMGHFDVVMPHIKDYLYNEPVY